MNQVKNMSLNKVHADVHGPDEAQPAMDSGVPRWRSMMIRQSIEGASLDIRGAASLPDTTGRIVAADEADSTKDELPERRSKTTAEKWKSFRLSTLKERREKVNARLQTKSSKLSICSSPQETW